jgi:signal transduction histidine kinase
MATVAAGECPEGGLPRHRDAGPLDAGHGDDGELPQVRRREAIKLEARQVDVQRELDRLREELEQARASRRRLVLTADADRHAIERELHDGVYQRLVALAVSLQLAAQTEGPDPAAVEALLAEMGRDVQDALDEAARLAQRIHPATLEAGDLAALLRSAATGAGVPAVVDVSAGAGYPPEVVMTIHVCWLDTLARAGNASRAAIEVRDGVDALTFEITGTEIRREAGLDRLRDRVEALGGRLTVTFSDGQTLVGGSMPLER